MPVSHQVPLQSPSKSALTRKVADPDFGRAGVESCCDVESELRVDVERRVESQCVTVCPLTNASGANSFVGFGGNSSISNHQRQTQVRHNDDDDDDDDDDDGSLEFGGVRSGGSVTSGGVRSGVVLGSVAVIDLVEGLSNVHNDIVEDINDILQ